MYDAMLSSLRNGTEKLIPKYFPDLMNSTRRIEFLPVEWRTDLQLDGGKHGINTILWSRVSVNFWKHPCVCIS